MLTFKTSLGSFSVELDAKEAPLTVENFLAYVDSGHFAGTVFHRVIPGFVIQGGGLTADLRAKPTRAPVKNEAANGLKNRRGTLSMARTNDIHSATSQFFVNLTDNASLDQRPGSFGYAVFGRVVKGMEVVDAIAKVKTGSKGHHDDVPVEPVVLESVTRAEG
jgi:cyclophilin family peptidyl-prolyl cis-trans isomerase